MFIYFLFIYLFINLLFYLFIYFFILFILFFFLQETGFDISYKLSPVECQILFSEKKKNKKKQENVINVSSAE